MLERVGETTEGRRGTRDPVGVVGSDGSRPLVTCESTLLRLCGLSQGVWPSALLMEIISNDILIKRKTLF